MTASPLKQGDERAKPRASVVLPTHNRCASLVKVLRALATQTVLASEFEVLVVADGCNDDTVPACRALQRELPYALRLIEQANAGPAAARNRAVQEATAALIVFIDDDVVPDARWLEVHLAAHGGDAGTSVVAIGPLLPPEDVRLNAWGAWEEATLCGHYADMRAGRWQPSYRQLYTGNASIARSRILEAGGFDERYRRAEDIELGYRLRQRGSHFIFLHDARAWHYVQRSFAGWARMPIAYGAATVMMGRAQAIVNVENAASEYLKRNRPTRACTQLCLGSPLRTALFTQALRLIAAVTWTLHLQALTFMSCGIAYNLLYYVEMSRELGGAATFRALIGVARRARSTRASGAQSELASAVATVLGGSATGFGNSRE